MVVEAGRRQAAGVVTRSVLDRVAERAEAGRAVAAVAHVRAEQQQRVRLAGRHRVAVAVVAGRGGRDRMHEAVVRHVLVEQRGVIW